MNYQSELRFSDVSGEQQHAEHVRQRHRGVRRRRQSPAPAQSRRPRRILCFSAGPKFRPMSH